LQAYTNVNTNPDTALAVLYTAAAELFTSDPDTDQAAVAVTQARTLAPGHKTEWITQLARLATHQPAVLALIRT